DLAGLASAAVPPPARHARGLRRPGPRRVLAHAGAAGGAAAARPVTRATPSPGRGSVCAAGATEMAKPTASPPRQNADRPLRDHLVALLRGGSAHLDFDKAVADL